MMISRALRSAALVLAAVLLVVPIQRAHAQDDRLLPARATDLVVAQTRAVQRAPGGATERAPVEFFQPLEADAALSFDAAPLVAESREYWQRVDGGQLRNGYALALTAPGAVVLISPSVGASSLRGDQITIGSGDRRVPFAEAADTLVDADALRAAGMEVRAGSIGFRLRDGLESDASVQVSGARGAYLLHVLEPRSDDIASLRTARDIVHAGDAIDVVIGLAGGARIDSANGLLVAPDGSSHDLVMTATRDGLRGRVVVPPSVTAQPGLWDVRVGIAAIEGNRAFQRDVRTAVAVAVPTARLTGEMSRHNRRGDGARILVAGLDVATAGRYELRGVLYGTAVNGVAVPLGIAHSAAWLEAGRHKLSLAYPALDREGISGPYVLRDLRLSDQSAIAVLERRDRPYTFD